LFTSSSSEDLILTFELTSNMITTSPLRLAFYTVLATVFTSAAFAQDRNQCLSRIDVYVPKDPADQYDNFLIQDTIPANDEERFDKTWLDAAEPDAGASEEVKKYKLLGSYSWTFQDGPKTFWAKNDFGDEGPTETTVSILRLVQLMNSAKSVMTGRIHLALPTAVTMLSRGGSDGGWSWVKRTSRSTKS
jgi:hypothetical protein